MAATLKTQQNLYDAFIQEVQTQRPDLTDTNIGSIIDVLAGVVSSAVDEVNRVSIDQFNKTFIDTAEGADLERLAVDHFGSAFARPPASKATGSVTFTRATTTAGNVLIPAGTVVKTQTTSTGKSQRYAVIADVTMTGTSITAGVQALVAGPDGNAQTGTVTAIETTLTDTSITVNNPAPFVGGANKQDDSAYRETIRNLIESVTGGTIQAVQAAALAVSGVAYATGIETQQCVIQYDPVGLTTSGSYFYIPRAKLYICDANGNSNPALIANVKAATDKVRADGVHLDIIGAQAVSISWNGTVVLNPSGPNYATLSSNSSLISSFMSAYIQALPIGTSFSRALARLAVLAKFGPSGSNDITDFQTNSPTGDISITATQKAVPGTVSIS